MNKELIPYEQALELNELGFDEPCFDKYIPTSQKLNSDMETWGEFYPETAMIPAPLYQQAFRWFDENTSFQGFVIASLKEGHFDWEILNLDTEEKIECKEYYHTRLKAELECLKQLIEIAKKNKSFKNK